LQWQTANDLRLVAKDEDLLEFNYFWLFDIQTAMVRKAHSTAENETVQTCFEWKQRTVSDERLQ